MFSIFYFCFCVVFILCLIVMWCGNFYMLLLKVVKLIYKGFNVSGLCFLIFSFLFSLNIGVVEGVGVILLGRFMGKLMIRFVFIFNGLCVRRCGKRILDLGYILLCLIIGLVCIKVGIVW